MSSFLTILSRKISLRNVLDKIMSSLKDNKSKHPNKVLITEERLVWVDLEMTGLEVDTCKILEIACLITDGKLNIVAEGPDLVIHHPDDVLENMNQWCIEQHGKTGLTEASRKSDITLKTAEMEVLSFVRKYTPPGKCPLAGNSVHADRKFLEKYMPELTKHLHYRIVDVSTIKELCKRWYPAEYRKADIKKATHRAMQDIIESINELKYYRGAIFK